MKKMSEIELDKFLTELGCLKHDLEVVKTELERTNNTNTNCNTASREDCSHDTTIRALNQMGSIYFDRYEFNSALECFLRVLLVNKIFYTKDHLDLAASYRNVYM